MQISKYFASMGIEVDKSSIKKVDKALDHVENRLKKLGKFANKPIVLSIGSFDVDQRKLNIALGNALDIASNRLTFEISRFNVNQSRLNGAMVNAMANASALANRVTNLTPNVNLRATGRSRIRESAAAGAVAGGVGGLRGIPNLFGPALALGLGGYGLGALNRRNQEVVSAQLQSSAVVQQAMGDSYTPAAGKGSFEWLRSQANETGFNYLDAVPSYNKLLSGVTGAGMSVQQGQGIFKGFSRLARVMKLDKV